MDIKAREEMRAYKRAWAARNREKIKEYQERYWLRRAEKRAAEQREDLKAGICQREK